MKCFNSDHNFIILHKGEQLSGFDQHNEIPTPFSAFGLLEKVNKLFWQTILYQIFILGEILSSFVIMMLFNPIIILSVFCYTLPTYEWMLQQEFRS